MRSVELSEVMVSRGGSIDPARFPDEIFDLYSIPAFDRAASDLVPGRSIGSTKQVVRPGDVLLSKIVPHIRRSWVVGNDRGHRLIASGEWIVFHHPSVDARYLRHVLVGNPFHAQFMATVSGVGGSLLRARPAYVGKIRVPLPPLEEQRRIADILDRADTLRAKRREAIALLDDLSQSIFLDTFGTVDTSPFVTELREIVRPATGSTPSRSEQTYFGGSIPWVKTGEVVGGVITSTEESITEEGRAAARCRLYPPGSIVIALYGQGRTRGQCAVLGVSAAVNQACAVLQPNANYDTDFLFAQLGLAYERLRAMARGGNQANLNLQLIGSLPMILPPIEMQKDFRNRAVTVTHARDAMIAQARCLEGAFASLQQRAFAGVL